MVKIVARLVRTAGSRLFIWEGYNFRVPIRLEQIIRDSEHILLSCLKSSLVLSGKAHVIISPQDPELLLLRHQLLNIFLGTIFLFVGVSACVIAVIRRRANSRLLTWFGLFIGLYGFRMLVDVSSTLSIVPVSPWPFRLIITVDYVVVIPAFLFWFELSLGWLRQLLRWLVYISSAVSLIGLSWFAISGSPYKILRINMVLAIFSMVLLGSMVVSPRMTRKYLSVKSTAVRIAMPIIALVTVYVNSMWFFGTPPTPYVEPITFALWVSAIGYEAAKHTFENERRLLSLDSELDTARQIQSSILPDRTPVIEGLRISAAYQPMSAVAGDFYQFVQTEGQGIGLIVADVTGHGVPAALIASMIKVAMQSAVPVASAPAEVLSLLNRILTPELQGRLTSAAYIWIDRARGTANYAGAGHPPLLHWKPCTGELISIESNGLLFGVMSDAKYPECQVEIASGDRLLLYTDGLVEADNEAGEAFGDRNLKDLVREHRTAAAQELSQILLRALRTWQPASQSQQDDITLVIVDVL